MSEYHDSAAIAAEPPVYLDAQYADRLTALASVIYRRNPATGKRLMNELERATILPSEDMAPDIVNIGSVVTFRDEAIGQSQTVTLVLPNDADINRRLVSVLTPIGVALIGLRCGASINWERPDGTVRKLTIEHVVPTV